MSNYETTEETQLLLNQQQQVTIKQKLFKLYNTRIRYYIPVLSWLPKYNYSFLKCDMTAGLTVAFLIIPQGLSYSQALVKIPPVHGLYTACISLLLYCLLGTSKQLSVGPEALVSILVGASIQNSMSWKKSSESITGSISDLLANDDMPERIAIATLICFMVGILTFFLGFFRLGFLDSILSRALLRGFVLAVACVVFIDMSDTLLGNIPIHGQCLDYPTIPHMFQITPNTPIESPISKLIGTLLNISNSHMLTTLISFFSISYLLGIKYLKANSNAKWVQVFPDILVLVVISTLLCQFFRWDCMGVAILNRVQAFGAYSYPKLPPINVESVKFLMLSSILISVIGFVESIAAAKEYASKHNYGISPNRELVAIGINVYLLIEIGTANIISSVFGGYPAYGSLGRTAVNDTAGAKTQLAGGMAGLIVLLVNLFFLPFFEYLPKSVCSSIIVVAAIKLVDLHDVYFIIRLRAWNDLGLLLLTFLTTIFISIESGTLISVGVSLLLVVKHTTKTRLAILGRTLVVDPKTGDVKEKFRSINEDPSIMTIESFLIIRLEEGLFFGNSGQLKDRLKRIEIFGDLSVHPGEEPRPSLSGVTSEIKKEIKALIFDMTSVTDIDASAIQTLLEIVKEYHKRKISVYFVKVRDSCKNAFLYSGIYDVVGSNNFFRKIRDAIDEEMNNNQRIEGESWSEEHAVERRELLMNDTNVPTRTPFDEEVLASWAILLMISLLFLILYISYYLQLKKIRIIHETVVSIILGAFVGLLISLSADKGLKRFVKFDHKYFFNLLLPPIILHSGYDLKTNHFFRNIFPILTFAFIGTFISTILIGCLVYLIALTRIHHLEMTFIDCLTFGAILSSTDPVTILAIFNQVGVEPKLYSIIFGESILNDSVAIVLFGTLSKLGNDVGVSTIFNALFNFFAVFTGSVLIGVSVALASAILLKYSSLKLFPSLESCLISLLAYFSYLSSNSLQLSGIVSLLFCGMSLKHYCYPNMSIRTKRTTKYMFRVLSQLSENFIFIYLGVSLFTMEDSYYPGLIFFTLIFIVVARYASTIPLANLINMLHKKIHETSDELIPRNEQVMLWWAGLRGAIAFALSFDVVGKAGPAIRTTTLVVCVISIMVLGGSTNFALKHLKIETGYGSVRRKSERQNLDEADELTDSSVDDESDHEEVNINEFPRTSIDSELGGSPEDALQRSFRYRRKEISNWIMNFDDQYMKPFFTGNSQNVKRKLSKSSNESPTRENLLRVETRPSSRAFGVSKPIESSKPSATGKNKFSGIDNYSKNDSNSTLEYK